MTQKKGLNIDQSIFDPLLYRNVIPTDDCESMKQHQSNLQT